MYQKLISHFSVTDVVAVTGASSSLWLKDINDGLLVPAATILGIGWLILKIFYLVKHEGKDHD